VKSDLKATEDIKEIIQCPIWSLFGLRRPKVEIDDAVEACQRAFSTVCSFTGTRDLIQEHIAFRVWPLVESWEMLKETITDSGAGNLVQLKYTVGTMLRRRRSCRKKQLRLKLLVRDTEGTIHAASVL
jgi:hypothetical protein